MKPHILLIGSGAYGSFIQSALETSSVTVVDQPDQVSEALVPATHVIVATPNDSHAEIVRQALLLGKNVLCEKPLALTLPDIKALYQVAQKEKRYLGVTFVLPHHPFYKLAKTWQSRAGTLREMRVYNHATEGMLNPNWYWETQHSGGWFMVSEIHWYHLFAWLTGVKKLAVMQASEAVANKRTVATWSVVTASGGAKLAVDHRLDTTYHHHWTRVELVFERATMLLDDWVPRWCDVSDEGLIPNLDDTFRQEGTRLIDIRPRDDIYKQLVRDNVEACLNGQAIFDKDDIILAHKVALEAQSLSDEPPKKTRPKSAS